MADRRSGNAESRGAKPAIRPSVHADPSSATARAQGSKPQHVVKKRKVCPFMCLCGRSKSTEAGLIRHQETCPTAQRFLVQPSSQATGSGAQPRAHGASTAREDRQLSRTAVTSVHAVTGAGTSADGEESEGRDGDDDDDAGSVDTRPLPDGGSKPTAASQLAMGWRRDPTTVLRKTPLHAPASAKFEVTSAAQPSHPAAPSPVASSAGGAVSYGAYSCACGLRFRTIPNLQEHGTTCLLWKTDGAALRGTGARPPTAGAQGDSVATSSGAAKGPRGRPRTSKTPAAARTWRGQKRPAAAAEAGGEDGPVAGDDAAEADEDADEGAEAAAEEETPAPIVAVAGAEALVKAGATYFEGAASDGDGNEVACAARGALAVRMPYRA